MFVEVRNKSVIVYESRYLRANNSSTNLYFYVYIYLQLLEEKVKLNLILKETVKKYLSLFICTTNYCLSSGCL